MSINDSKMLTVKEVGDILRIGRGNAYVVVKKEGFPVIKVGKQLRVPADDFKDWLRKQINSSK